MREHPIVERLLYRIIRKHIAGTTMSSAIDRAKELDGKKLFTSITFLSDVAKDSTKARYATTTYLELIRRIARTGLRSSVQVPFGQVGYGISKEVFAKNLSEIISTANKYGVFVWLEQPKDYRLPQFLHDTKGVGYVRGVGDSVDYLNINKGKIKAMKVICSENAEGKKEKRSMSDKIKFLIKNTKSVVLQSVPENVMREFLVNSYKKSLVFEFQLGYSGNAMSKLIKRGARMSVYLPFGKDWTPYAINKVPERYARFIAGRLLTEEEGRGI